jgi:hypothetical protein
LSVSSEPGQARIVFGLTACTPNLNEKMQACMFGWMHAPKIKSPLAWSGKNTTGFSPSSSPVHQFMESSHILHQLAK